MEKQLTSRIKTVQSLGYYTIIKEDTISNIPKHIQLIPLEVQKLVVDMILFLRNNYQKTGKHIENGEKTS